MKKKKEHLLIYFDIVIIDVSTKQGLHSQKVHWQQGWSDKIF